jgi:hypothetical protein
MQTTQAVKNGDELFGIHDTDVHSSCSHDLLMPSSLSARARRKHLNVVRLYPNHQQRSDSMSRSKHI